MNKHNAHSNPEGCPFHHQAPAVAEAAPPLMSQSTINIIKATAPVVGPHALDITQTFYPMMFQNNPEALQFFNITNQKRGKQPQALANAVIAFATNIEHLGNLTAAVDIMAHKHCGLNVLPEHYAIVHKNLMMAIGKVLGDAVTEEIGAAWSEAVLALAKILITREAELYNEAAARNGGWRGWRPFNVVEKKEVAKDMFMFKFKPTAADGAGPTYFDFTPGQFLSVHFPEGINGNPRHYTVVSEPGADHLAIIVKRLHAPREFPEAPAGYVSNLMANTIEVGSTVELTPPFGPFRLETPPHKPVLLVSAGVGMTPALAMMQQCKTQGHSKVISVHQDHSKDSHAFAEYFASAATHSFVRYSKEDNTWRSAGHINQDDLSSILSSCDCVPENTTAYVCGPDNFMYDVKNMLKALGITQIHCEAFGPQLSSKST